MSQISAGAVKTPICHYQSDALFQAGYQIDFRCLDTAEQVKHRPRKQRRLVIRDIWSNGRCEKVKSNRNHDRCAVRRGTRDSRTPHAAPAGVQSITITKHRPTSPARAARGPTPHGPDTADTAPTPDTARHSRHSLQPTADTAGRPSRHLSVGRHHEAQPGLLFGAAQVSARSDVAAA